MAALTRAEVTPSRGRAHKHAPADAEERAARALDVPPRASPDLRSPTVKLLSLSLSSLVALAALPAGAVELYGGVGTTGLEVGVSQPLSSVFSARLDYNWMHVSRNFSTSDIDYDAKIKASNVGVYLDGFVGGGLRVTAGALIGQRKVHGVARSVGSTITLNGVTYPVAASDTLDFDADFPTVTPYLGIGFGHRQSGAGLRVYGDAGVAWGRPDVRLSPSASLAAKVNPSDLAAEQDSAQDKANRLRAYPVVKLGVGYAF